MATGNVGKQQQFGTSSGSGHVIAIKLRNVLPDFLNSVKLKYVVRGLTHAVTTHAVVCMLLVPVLTLTGMEITRLGHETSTLQVIWAQLQYNVVSVLATTSACVFALTVYFLTRPRRVYLVDFACYKPDESNAISRQELLSFAASTGKYTYESLDFQRKILERSGMGDSAYIWKKAMCSLPVDSSKKCARDEAATTMFYSLDELFAKTGVTPKEVKILVVNCSLFNPTPSLSAMVVNRYKMRGDVTSVSIGGMGCSAGLIAIDLARDLLQAHRNSYALVCSQEVLSQSPYFGNDRAKLVTNCLFRLGGAAVLLSNKSHDGWRAKYELQHSVRTHKGADDRCYQCVFEVMNMHSLTDLLLSFFLNFWNFFGIFVTLVKWQDHFFEFFWLVG
jgi:3-ketoacyl-CoA synthase